MICRKSFEPNQDIQPFNSKLKLFPDKLKSKWVGAFIVQQVFPSGAVQILDPQCGGILMVNGQRLKPVVTYDIDPGLIESINLVDHVYYDQWVRPCLAKDTKLRACWKATQSFQESFSLLFYFLFFLACLCFQL